jgi:hypothetical protein
MTMRDAANQLPGPSLGMDVGLRRALDILCAGAAAAALAPLMLIVTLRSAASLLEVSWTSCRNSGTFCGVICRSWGHGPSRLASLTASATGSRRFTSTSPAFLGRVRSCFDMKATLPRRRSLSQTRNSSWHPRWT